MRAKTILSVLFLISLGVVAMLYLQSLPQRINASIAAAKETLVATMPLAPGTLLRAEDVTWKRTSRAAELGQISRPSAAAGETKPNLDQLARAEVYGAALRIGLVAGDPIRRGDIVEPGDRDFLQIVLAAGSRAITIPLAPSGASTGLLFPGDHVDIILTQTFKNNAPLMRRSVSETVVESLRVLAVDAGNAKPTAASNGFGRTVTLEVTPEQGEKINVAIELGKLSLTLRGVSSTGHMIGASMPGTGKTAAVKPTWAGDVSPALGGAMPPEKVVAAEQPPVEIIHGIKRETVKPQ
jgi:pilus assembly protein CpaB